MNLATYRLFQAAQLTVCHHVICLMSLLHFA